MRIWGSEPRAIRIADAVTAALLSQILAQQHGWARIEKSHEDRMPSHINLATDPTWRRTVVDPCFRKCAAAQAGHVALHALVAAGEALIIDQVPPNASGVAPPFNSSAMISAYGQQALSEPSISELELVFPNKSRW
jgi:hypothetical protein